MSEDCKEPVEVFLCPKTVEMIESKLEYGDSRSAWIRRAVRNRLQIDDAVANDNICPHEIAELLGIEHVNDPDEQLDLISEGLDDQLRADATQ